MIPELTVSDINKTKEFYLNILGFKLEYEREADRFIFLSFEETQLMFEEMHENGWNVAEMSNTTTRRKRQKVLLQWRSAVR